MTITSRPEPGGPGARQARAAARGSAKGALGRGAPASWGAEENTLKTKGRTEKSEQGLVFWARRTALLDDFV